MTQSTEIGPDTVFEEPRGATSGPASSRCAPTAGGGCCPW